MNGRGRWPGDRGERDWAREYCGREGVSGVSEIRREWTENCVSKLGD